MQIVCEDRNIQKTFNTHVKCRTNLLISCALGAIFFKFLSEIKEKKFSKGNEH